MSDPLRPRAPERPASPCAGGRVATRRRRLVARVVALALAAAAAVAGAGAWDDDRMAVAAQRLGAGAVAAAQALRPALVQAAEMGETDRLAFVNDYVNRHLRFRDDIDVWGQVDYWASPLESLGRGEGDCEDYAIAKYFSLVAAGTPVARLRLVYVRAQLRSQPQPQAHMVLAYYPHPEAEPLILDNLDATVRAASRRRDLQPVFSFNGEGLWQGVGAQSAGDPVARLSRWREVLGKARAEGFEQ